MNLQLDAFTKNVVRVKNVRQKTISVFNNVKSLQNVQSKNLKPRINVLKSKQQLFFEKRLLAGWNGARCERWEYDVPACLPNNECAASSLDSLACHEAIPRVVVDSCVDEECRLACSPGVSVEQQQDIVCFRSMEQGLCGEGFGCNATGACTPLPTHAPTPIPTTSTTTSTTSQLESSVAISTTTEASSTTTTTEASITSSSTSTLSSTMTQMTSSTPDASNTQSTLQTSSFDSSTNEITSEISTTLTSSMDETSTTLEKSTTTSTLPQSTISETSFDTESEGKMESESVESVANSNNDIDRDFDDIDGPRVNNAIMLEISLTTILLVVSSLQYK